MPLHVDVLALYVQFKVMNNSINQLNAVCSMYNWYYGIMGYQPLFNEDPFFIQTKKSLRKNYDYGKDDRLPITLAKDIAYAKDRGVSVVNAASVNFNTLVDVMVAQILSSIGVRGTNVLDIGIWDKVNQRIDKGLFIEDIVFSDGVYNEQGKKSCEFVIIRIKGRKTAKNKMDDQFIELGDSGHPVFNPFKYIKIYYNRRCRMAKKYKLQGNISMYDKIKLKKGKPFLLFEDGSRYNKECFQERVIGHMYIIFDIPQGFKISIHSFRIGAATKMSLCGLSDSYISQYIGWSEGAASSMLRYIRLDQYTKAQMQAEIISRSNL